MGDNQHTRRNWRDLNALMDHHDIDQRAAERLVMREARQENARIIAAYLREHADLYVAAGEIAVECGLTANAVVSAAKHYRQTFDMELSTSPRRGGAGSKQHYLALRERMSQTPRR